MAISRKKFLGASLHQEIFMHKSIVIELRQRALLQKFIYFCYIQIVNVPYETIVSSNVS